MRRASLSWLLDEELWLDDRIAIEDALLKAMYNFEYMLLSRNTDIRVLWTHGPSIPTSTEAS